jgi:uncharacterized protein involved in exopolysaccharide biosynthesis
MSIRILDHIFRRKLLLVVPVVIGTVLGILWMISSFSSQFVSRATVWVERPADFSGAGVSLADFNPYLTPSENQANSLREVMGSASFLSAVAKRVDGVPGTPWRNLQLRNRTSVYQFGDHVLYIAYGSQDPNEAAKVVQAVIDEYSAVLARQVKEQATLSATFYKEQADMAKVTFENATADLNAYIRAHPQLATAAAARAQSPGTVAISDPEFSKLQINQQNAESQYNAMWGRYAASQIAATSTNATSSFFSVIDAPEVPLAPLVQRKRTMAIKPISGMMVGAMVAVGLFLVSWRVDRKVRFATDLAFLGDVVVVTLPALKARQRRWPASFVRMASAIHGGIRDLSSRPTSADSVGAEGV